MQRCAFEGQLPVAIGHGCQTPQATQLHLHLLVGLGVRGALEREARGRFGGVEQGPAAEKGVQGRIGGRITEGWGLTINRDRLGAQDAAALFEHQAVIAGGQGIEARFRHHPTPAAIALGDHRGQQRGANPEIQALAGQCLRHRALEFDAMGIGGLGQAEPVVARHLGEGAHPIHFDAAAAGGSSRKRIAQGIGDAVSTRF